MEHDAAPAERRLKSRRRASVEAASARFDRALDLMQQTATATAVAVEAIKAHSGQCEEREKRHQAEHERFDKDLAQLRAAHEETLRRIEHDGRNARQEVQALANQLLPDVRALKQTAEVSTLERHRMAEAVGKINKLLWSAVISLLGGLVAVVMWLLAHYVFVGATLSVGVGH